MIIRESIIELNDGKSIQLIGKASCEVVGVRRGGYDSLLNYRQARLIMKLTEVVDYDEWIKEVDQICKPILIDRILGYFKR